MESHRPKGQETQDPQASMGPRPIGHGEGGFAGCFETGGGASMGPQPIGHGELTTLLILLTQVNSFNGATANRPWRERRRVLEGFYFSVLQWGHGQ